MSRRIRTGIFFAFITIFIIATGLISLSASGYRFNPSWPPQFNRLLIKTGMLIVSSLPSGANVYLNDELLIASTSKLWSDKYLNTEAKIKNLLPGEYLLRLERDGYWTWEKTISIQPGQTNHVLNVNLFRTDQPQLIYPAQAKELKLSSSRRYLYAQGEEKIISLRNGESLSLKNDNSNNQNSDQPAAALPGAWRNNSDELLLGSRLFSPTRGLIADYSDLIGAGIKSRYDDSYDRIYYLNNGSLAYLNPARRTINTVLNQKNILSYEARGDIIWYLSVDKNRALVKKYSLSSEAEEVYQSLPINGDYEFKNGRAGQVAIYDSQNNALYLLDSSTPLKEPLILADVLGWEWLNDKTLLYHNNWEIYRLDIKSGSSYLLTRLSQTIKKIIWQPNRNYLLVLTDQGLFAYDLRLETLTNIFMTQNIISPVLDQNANALYFQAEIDDQSGIYRLRLQ